MGHIYRVIIDPIARINREKSVGTTICCRKPTDVYKISAIGTGLYTVMRKVNLLRNLPLYKYSSTLLNRVDMLQAYRQRSSYLPCYKKPTEPGYRETYFPPVHTVIPDNIAAAWVDKYSSRTDTYPTCI